MKTRRGMCVLCPASGTIEALAWLVLLQGTQPHQSDRKPFVVDADVRFNCKLLDNKMLTTVRTFFIQNVKFLVCKFQKWSYSIFNKNWVIPSILVRVFVLFIVWLFFYNDLNIIMLLLAFHSLSLEEKM